MNFNLFLIILIALILIFCIILYNGIRILLAVGKEKDMVKYEFKVTILKIPIFKRAGNEGIIGIIRPNPDGDSEETEEGDSKSKDKSTKSEDENVKSEDNAQTGKSSEDKEEDDKTSDDEEEEKSLREKYKGYKPILNELKKSKEELKAYLNNLLKAFNLKKLEGHLILGLSDHTTTVKIASWIWSIGAIVNSKKPALLTVEPRFNEVIIDFEGKIELKINLLLIIIYSLLLLTKKNIRELIKEIYRQKKAKDKAYEEGTDERLEEELGLEEQGQALEKEPTPKIIKSD